MPEIKPFRGIVYNTSKVRLSAVVAPPYDVISPRQQEELYAASPLNIVRLILGREPDRYQSAAKFYREWRDSGVLTRDGRPAIYALSQEFSLPGAGRVIRRGFICACRLEEFGTGTIFPHEKTLPKPKEDRLRLLEATQAMFSQIFVLFSDPHGALRDHVSPDSTPDLEVEFDRVCHRLWRVTDFREIAALEEALLRQKVFVADGHHRYETALSYATARRLRNPAHTGKEAYNFVPMFFAAREDPGLIILPTHRVVHEAPELDEVRLRRHIAGRFEVRPAGSLGELLQMLSAAPGHAFGMVLRSAPEFSLIRLTDRGREGLFALPPLLAQLDVTVLHTVVFKGILSLPQDQHGASPCIGFEKDAERAAAAVGSGQAQAAFLVKPTGISQVRAVAEAGLTMPQKSTYFTPKLLSGLVTYSLDD